MERGLPGSRRAFPETDRALEEFLHPLRRACHDGAVAAHDDGPLHEDGVGQQRLEGFFLAEVAARVALHEHRLPAPDQLAGLHPQLPQQLPQFRPRGRRLQVVHDLRLDARLRHQRTGRAALGAAGVVVDAEGVSVHRITLSCQIVRQVAERMHQPSLRHRLALLQPNDLLHYRQEQLLQSLK